jgi:hypothetical protein
MRLLNEFGELSYNSNTIQQQPTSSLIRWIWANALGTKPTQQPSTPSIILTTLMASDMYQPEDVTFLYIFAAAVVLATAAPVRIVRESNYFEIRHILFNWVDC